ncbi:MAG TPA: cytochrome P450 [Candidatus Binataceae bacterium]|nr:cytochrome P450 [Candidatus Binataceae bacterium]
MKLSEVNLMDLELFVNGNPHEAFAVLRREAPVHWHERSNGRGFWAVTRYQDALRVYHDPEIYSSERGISLMFDDVIPDQAGSGMMMILTDPPRHNRIRQIVSSRFTPRVIAAYAPEVRRICDEILDAVCERGECDFVVDVAGKVPTAAICEMLGIPAEYRDMMYMLGNAAIGSQDPEYNQGRSAMETGRNAQAEFFSYFAKLIDERRKRPGGDLISALTLGEVGGVKLTDLEILFNAFLLIIGGQETTRNAISGGTLALVEFPEQRARLAGNPAVMPTAIEEFLRWTTPVTHILRTARQDTELNHQKIHEGDKVVVWNASVNRDEEVFPDADQFDVTRSPNDHLAFGHGEHFCVGSHLARLEMLVMIEQVMRRMPGLELAAPPERLRSNFVAGIKHMPVRFTPSAVHAGA